MRGKVGEIEEKDEQYRFSNSYSESDHRPKKRLDLNDLLKRAEEEKKSDKKLNLLIFSGTIAVTAVLGLIFSF